MKRVSFLNQQVKNFVPLAALGVSFVLTLTGCPGGAELEHPEAYGLTGGQSSTNGTGAAAGTTGNGTGGTSGTSSSLTVDCGASTYQTVLSGSCATGGCHLPNAAFNFPGASNLNLTPDDGLVGRLKDVKAQHGDISCPPDFNTCVPSACDTNVLLVDSKNAANSWILAKIHGTQNGCGDSMPTGTPLTADKQTCIENFVNAVAALP